MKRKPARPVAAPLQGGSDTPSKDDLLRFIRDHGGTIGKRELARAFGIKGGDRVHLKTLIRELEDEGAIQRGPGRRFARAGSLPEVSVVQVVGIDADGELQARPIAWREDDPPPRIILAPQGRGRALAVGARALVRLRQIGDHLYEGQVIRPIGGAPSQVLGIYAIGPEGGRLRPTSRKERAEYVIGHGDAGDAQPGELVLAEVLASSGRVGLRKARVVERLGDGTNPRSYSLIAIHTHDIPAIFPEAALAEAEAAEAAPLKGREDLRDIPLVTIDGEDARDFDDAVWAEPDLDPANRGGWHCLVAIADVAWYVRPGSALDKEALKRGNSVYFPDRVVPMLPEALSNGWCSLKPREERPCLAVEMWFDASGTKLRHRFLRGLMRSAARLTYTQAQEAQDGLTDETTSPLLDPVIRPLFGAFAALDEARRQRGTLELDLPERKVVIGEDGRVLRVEPRARFDSHRLIEEFMIAANVCAAETLEAKRQPCMYRVHDQPSPEKLRGLKEFLSTLDLPFTPNRAVKAANFTQLLRKVEDRPEAHLVNTVVLRSQAQAEYAPDNIGHFGLALGRYAHFTSPIRRYSDLLVHRALIRGLGLGPGGLSEAEADRFAEIGAEISKTERRAMAAEREAVDRFTASFLSGRVGAVFAGKVSGVSRFGLFVNLDESGADGLVPVSTLPADYYRHEESRHALVGTRSGRTYSLGQRVEVLLSEADPLTGSLVFHLMEEEDSPRRPGAGRQTRGKSTRSGPRGRGHRGR